MRRAMRVTALISSVAVAVGLLAGVPAQAERGADREGKHSDNIQQLAQVPIVVQRDDPKTEEDERELAEGSDLAFQDDLLVAGSFSHGFALFKILPKAPYLKQLSLANCPGSQADVSVFKDLVFVSVDATLAGPKCGEGAASQAQVQSDSHWEGVRIFDISNPKRPSQVAAVKTDCGSHTHTLVPAGKDKLYVYVGSYPISGQGPACNDASHRKISVIDVPMNNPAKAKVIGTPSVSPAKGCHDITTFPQKNLAFAACLTESQVWDIKNPKEPRILSHIYNPFINIHHSTAMTWDGKYIVIGDEFSGAIGYGCLGSEDAPVGAMWFYDIRDPADPQQAGYFGPPRRALPGSVEEAEYSRCTTHNFNVLPTKDSDKYLVTSSYYTAGLNLIDFSDPANPEEVAYYVPTKDDRLPSLWAAYWYNGRIYANDFESRAGVSVYEVERTGAKDIRYFDDRLNPQVQIADFK